MMIVIKGRFLFFLNSEQISVREALRLAACRKSCPAALIVGPFVLLCQKAFPANNRPNRAERTKHGVSSAGCLRSSWSNAWKTGGSFRAKRPTRMA